MKFPILDHASVISFCTSATYLAIHGHSIFAGVFIACAFITAMSLAGATIKK